MEVTQNANYFEAQLQVQNTGGNNPEVNQLIVDMVEYARRLEADTNIPPGGTLPPRTRPEEPQSVQFRLMLDQLVHAIPPTLFSLFEDFLVYIISLESSTN